MSGGLTMSYVDYGEEVATCTFNGAEMTVLNFEAQASLIDALVTAVEAVVKGTFWKEVRRAVLERSSKVPPVSTDAQRERKWIIIYEDNTTYKHYNTELPCADLSLLKANSDEMDISAGAGAALVSAFEDYVLSPDGNAVTVLKVVHVGRNL